MKVIFLVFLITLTLGVFGLYLYVFHSDDQKKKIEQNPQSLQIVNSNSSINKKTTLSLEPDNITKKVGERFSTKVLISTELNKISGVEFYISYDSSKLEVEKISPGNFFEKPNILTNNVSLNKIDKEKGEIAYAIGTFNPKGGEGTLAIINFKVIGSANQTTLTLAPKTKVAAISYHESVLTSVNNAQYYLLP